MTVDKIVSGGQTGVDRAALDAALSLDITHGGWCPQGRRAEDGTIATQYRLRETPSSDYLQRTEWNVRDSDATLILTRGEVEGGTAATAQYAGRHEKPLLIVDLLSEPPVETARQWLSQNRIRTLNIAGPRASKQPAIYRQALDYLLKLLQS